MLQSLVAVVCLDSVPPPSSHRRFHCAPCRAPRVRLESDDARQCTGFSPCRTRWLLYPPSGSASCDQSRPVSLITRLCRLFRLMPAHRGPVPISVQRIWHGHTQTIFDHIHRLGRICVQPGPVDMDSFSGPWGPNNYPHSPARAATKPGRARGYGQISFA